MEGFNGLHMSLGNLSRLSDAKTRSICAENPTGGKGCGAMATDGAEASWARDLGVGWKVCPSIMVPAHSTVTLADITGSGAIQSIWMTPLGHWRFSILRLYWDDEETPSVETPLGDLFAVGWGSYAQVSSLPVAVNPGSALNCFWEMPFRRRARMTLENLDDEGRILYYQVNYTLTEVPADAGLFHAQFRRSNPLPYKQVHTILDGVRGQGHYVGTYIAWGSNNNSWWGEGEIKFYLDGDGEFPTICGTGTEDYFGGSYCFIDPETKAYREYTTAFMGLPQIIRPDGLYRSQQRFGLYRWHVMDPIRFKRDLRVTIQALGVRAGPKYLPLQDDIASTAFWYQREPHAPFPTLPDRDTLEVI